ncbi:ankyrin repeat and SOCS box containing 5 [Phyllostomus discolor]|uniref:Ankyrin repeat and SOCS box containing 5 n=1 Tax=Phyllostomus discolor TaxID=89673 RepID=A0A833Z013_9CHIR|nr:ankyrin repeat and SOCS box containing 5 [Phyllostomus discolor]
MSVLEESRPFAQQLSNVYFTILSLFCFKLFVKISLAILSHFYIVKGNRKEAARIAAEFYGVTQGQGSWADRSPLHEAASQGRLLALRTLLSQVKHHVLMSSQFRVPTQCICLLVGIFKQETIGIKCYLLSILNILHSVQRVQLVADLAQPEISKRAMRVDAQATLCTPGGWNTAGCAWERDRTVISAPACSSDSAESALARPVRLCTFPA